MRKRGRIIAALLVVAVMAAAGAASFLRPIATHAQASSLVATPALWRGGDSKPISWEGESPAITVEFSADKGVSWVSLGVKGASPLEVQIPKVDSNAATIRMLLEDGSIRTSDAFVVDSTAPVSAVTGRGFMSQGRGTAPKGRIVLPFDALGPDVSELVLRCTADGKEPFAAPPMLPADALRQGFVAPPDGIWNLTLIARDHVGNEEAKSAPDVRDFIVDTVAPVAKIRHAIDKYALGGERVRIEYAVDDANLELRTLKFEYLAGNVIREPVDFSPAAPAASREWLLPREDHREVRIRLTVSDRAGNTTITETEPFTLFSGRPQAAIVDEVDGGQSRIDFEIALLNAASLGDIDEDYRIDLYVANWDAAALRWVWDVEAPVRDLEPRMVEGKRFVTFTGSNVGKAFAARLVVGDGSNRLTEPVPTATTAPESIFRGVSRVARIKLSSQGSGALVYQSGRPIEFQYSVPDDVIRGSEVVIEYSINSGESWFPITAAPVPVNRERLVGSYVWGNPPGELEYAAVRAVTVLMWGTIEYRVSDVMAGGIVIDGGAPKAEIIRVLDELGRPLASGEYTNSRHFDIEWRASDTGGSGMADAVLWDDALHASGQATPETVWNQNEYEPGTLRPSAVPRKLDFTNPVVRVPFGGVDFPVGKVGFLVEGIDRAGNRRFRLGRPDANEARPFSLNIDYLPPKVVLTETPSEVEALPGAQVRIGWLATDNTPDPLVEDSLGPAPVSIYVLDDQGRQSLIATGLEASGSMLVTIPALSDTTIRFLVSARDRAGNSSGAITESSTRPIRVQNAAVPEVRLRRLVREDRGTLLFDWDLARAKREDLAELSLWLSMDGGKSWTKHATFSPSDVPTFQLPGPDGDFAFSLTSRTTSGLGEPDPRSPVDVEATWIVDTIKPNVELLVVPSRQIYFVGDDPPLVRARVSDAHFVADNTSLMATRRVEGIGASFETLKRGTDFTEGQWVELALPLGEEAQNIVLAIESRDIKGNVGEASITLEVRIRPRWQISGLSGEPPYYARTARDVIWSSRGEGAGKGRVNVYLQAVTGIEGGWRPIEGSMIPLGVAVPDSGRFAIPGGLPDVTGDYVLVLEPLDLVEPVGFIMADQMIRVIQPTPVTTLKPLEGAVQLGDGTAVYGAATPAALRLQVRHRGDDARPYELPMSAHSVRWRMTGTDGRTTPWQVLDATGLTRSLGPLAPNGDYATEFHPREGEGRYELISVFTDQYGFRSVTDGDPLTVVFDLGPPVVTVTSPSGAKAVYTDEDIARLDFTALDPLLDAETIALEYRSIAGQEWQPLPAAREVKELHATHARGAFAPQFPQPGRYLVRIVASDLVGQRGIGHLASPVYAGAGNYVAIRPIRAAGVSEDEDYTTSIVSRRADFRVHVEPIRPWEEGLRNLTLWWRWRTGDEDQQPSSWSAIHFPDRHLIGELSRTPTDAHDHDTYLNSLPFTAPFSGRYEFIVTSESQWGQIEEPRTPGPAAVPEMWCDVYAEPYSLVVEPLSAAGTQSADITTALSQGRIVAGTAYTLEWVIRTCVNEPLEPTLFTVQHTTDAGETWTTEKSLAAASATVADGEVELTETHYSVAVASREVGGVMRVERRYRARWTAPSDLADSDTQRVQIRIRSSERPTNPVPAFTRSADSRTYAIGFRADAPAQIEKGYYERLIEAGDDALKQGKPKDALSYYTQARAQNPTSEASRKVAEAESAIKLADAAAQRSEEPKLNAE